MAEPIDDWQPVAAAPAPASAPADDWQPVQPRTIDSRDPGAQAQSEAAGTTSIWRAFTNGYGEAFGDEPVGMSEKNYRWMQDQGFFRKEERGDRYNPVRAFNEGIIYGGSQALDGFLRSVRGYFHGAGAAALEAGAPRDIAGIIGGEYIPAGGSGIKAPPISHVMTYSRLRLSRDLGVIGPERPPLAEMKPAEA